MKIAVNTRFLLDDYLEGYGYFVLETFNRLSEKYPEHEFIFIFDRPASKKFFSAKNIVSIVVGPPARHPLLWKLWYDVKIPAVLKKNKADVFVSCDGFCSLTTKVPQCLVIHDLSFLHFPSFNKKSHVLFYKRYTAKFLNKAASIATVSEFSKQDILSHYKIDPSKIDVVYSAAKEIFVPVNDLKKESTKKKYADGKEYFVYTGAIHPRKNLMNLLKAFSIFKKRQQSNMKLVLAGRLAWKYDSFIENLKNYKYRNDVVMTGYLEETELARVIGSAYAMVYPSLWEGFGVPVLEAIHCDVPVITSTNSSMQEIAKDAALYADPADQNDIADKMMLLYKDEALRKKLIQKEERSQRNTVGTKRLICFGNASAKPSDEFSYLCPLHYFFMNKSTISIDVILDDNKVPQRIEWKASDTGAENAQKAKAMMLSFWDGAEKTALRIDLWTKDMMVDEMADFFYQTLMTMADSFGRATSDKEQMEAMKKFAHDFHHAFQHKHIQENKI